MLLSRILSVLGINWRKTKTFWDNRRAKYQLENSHLIHEENRIEDSDEQQWPQTPHLRQEPRKLPTLIEATFKRAWQQLLFWLTLWIVRSHIWCSYPTMSCASTPTHTHTHTHTHSQSLCLSHTHIYIISFPATSLICPPLDLKACLAQISNTTMLLGGKG